MSNTQIFITYKDRHKIIETDIIKPIQTGRAIANEIFNEMIGDNSGDNISKLNPQYCELSAIYWVWKHYEELGSPENIGFMHYRRLLNFEEKKNIKFFEQYNLDNKTINSLCENYDIVLPEKLPAYSPKIKKIAKNIKTQWELEYDKNDLDFVLDIINEKYPHMMPAAEFVLQQEKAYWYNIFVMKKVIFFEFCEWLFSILEQRRMSSNKDRLLGFLSERLLNIFVEYKKNQNLKVKEIPLFYPVPEQYNLQKNEIIPVVLISSNEYVPQTTTTMTSVIENCTEKQKLKFHILSEGIRNKNKVKIEKHIKQLGCNIEFTEITPQMTARYSPFPRPKHVSLNTFVRLSIPEIFAGYDKILYLDSDILVRKDISELFNTNIKEKCIGLVEDVANTYHTNRLWGEKTSNYYNTGVILFNASLMRKENYFENINNTIQINGGKYRLCDQDILNDVFRNSIQKLDTKWNHHHEFHGMLRYFVPSDRKEYEQNSSDPSIIHYVGSEKIWYNSSTRPYQDEYFKYWKETPFYKLWRIDNYKAEEFKFKNFNFDRKIIFQWKSNKNRNFIKLLGIKLTFPKIIKLISIEKTPYRKTINIFGIKIKTKRQNAELYKKLDTMHNEILNMNTIIQAQSLHRETFEKYKNAFDGKDVVLVCTGPTAKYYKPIKNAIHIGVNGAIYLNQVKLDYLFCQDNTINQPGNENLNLDINNYMPETCHKFYGIIPPNHLNKIKKNIERIPLSYAQSPLINQYILEEVICHNWAYDLSREPIGNFCGTPFSAMQFILYTNPKRLYLVGCDCSSGYAYNKNPNFIPVTGQKNIWINFIKPYLTKYFKNLEVISINPVGLKGIFSDTYTQNYINANPELTQENINILTEEEDSEKCLA